VEKYWVGVVHQFLNHLTHLARSGYAGVSDAEIKHLIRTDFRFATLTVFKDFADYGTLFAESHHFFV
jgi:hypothetical protein